MPEYAGKSTAAGPERPDISAHVFPGGHTEMLKKAAVVALSGRVLEKSGSRQVKLATLVTNIGSGHLMPTGIPGIRELWLELNARQTGKEVYARRVDFGAKMVDAQGNSAMPWKAVKIASDKRLAPQRSRRETFEFTVPMNSGAIEVDARLYYRLISETIARLAGIQPPEPIEVARDQVLISPEGWVTKLPVQ